MADPRNSPENQNLTPKYAWIFWLLALISGVGLIFARVVYAEAFPLTLFSCIGLVVALLALVQMHRTRIKARVMAYSLNSLVTTLLVLCILGVLNFLAVRYSKKLDVTKNRIHTLSDQTEKLVKGLKQPVQAVLYGQMEQSEAYRPLLNRYKALSPNFRVEYVNPDKEVSRARQNEIKGYGVLQLIYGERQEKIESPNEEKVTNALFKLTNSRAIVLCALTGHGEKEFTSAESDGYELSRRALARQAYEVKAVNLQTEGKIPADCTAIAINGPTRAFFPAEMTAIRGFLDQGGRAYIALDLNLPAGGTEFSPEIAGLLKDWYVGTPVALVIDPISRKAGLDPTVPPATLYPTGHPITKAFQETADRAKKTSFLPLTRFFQVLPGAPATLKVEWLAQSTPDSWAETDMAALKKGAVSFSAGQDTRGPVFLAMVVSGKKQAQAPRDSRIVVFGTSHFASNQFSRYGNNGDFFANSIAWLVEDETTISIRAREDGGGLINLSERAGQAIFVIAVILVPLLTAIAGIVIWILRKRL